MISSKFKTASVCIIPITAFTSAPTRPKTHFLTQLETSHHRFQRLSEAAPQNATDVISKTSYRERTGCLIDYKDPRTKGSYFVDAHSGRLILDFNSGFGSNPTGYNCPHMKRFTEDFGAAIANKPSLSDFMTHQNVAATQMILEDLVLPNGFAGIHFIDSGTSAVGHMITAARHTKWVKEGKTQQQDSYIIGAFRQTYHGTTNGLTEGNAKVDAFPKASGTFYFTPPRTKSEFRTLFSNTSTEAYNSLLEQLMQQCDTLEDRTTLERLIATDSKETRHHLPNKTFALLMRLDLKRCLADIDHYCSENPRKLAVLAFEDGIRCEAGDHYYPKEFYYGIQALAQKHDFFLAADGVQTALSTGVKPFAFQNIAPGFKPDMIAVSKKTTVGAVLFSPQFMQIPGNTMLEGGILDSTFGGDIGSIMRFAVVTHLVKHTDILETATQNGEHLFENLQRLQQQFPEIIQEVRGKGVTLTLEFTSKEHCQTFTKKAQEKGLLLLGSRNERIMRARLNLAVTPEEIDHGTAIMREVLNKMATPHSKL